MNELHSFKNLTIHLLFFRKKSVVSEMMMVVGLGNPGGNYAETRHNIGFKVIDSLAESLNIEVRKKKFGAIFGSGEFSGKKLILLKPWQYMNCSGQVIVTAVGFYKLALSNLLVISARAISRLAPKRRKNDLPSRLAEPVASCWAEIIIAPATTINIASHSR